ncbi:unnamed protein product, partial [Schistosoma mattheei]
SLSTITTTTTTTYFEYDTTNLVIADIQWQHHVSNAEARHRVFGHRDDNAIGVTILKRRIRWIGHVLRMSSQRIPRRALLADSETGWKKRRWPVYDMVSGV